MQLNLNDFIDLTRRYLLVVNPIKEFWSKFYYTYIYLNIYFPGFTAVCLPVQAIISLKFCILF